MKKWAYFVIGVASIAAPTSYFAYGLYWTVWKHFHPDPVHGESIGFVTTLGLLAIAAGFSVFGLWMIRHSRGDDDRPHSLFSN
jgi:hypothetical protein